MLVSFELYLFDLTSYSNYTQWFRNLRQTTRRRAKKAGSGEEDDEEDDEQDVYFSRSGSPSSSAGTREGSMINDYKVTLPSGTVSDAVSDDEYEEAVTPSSESSRSPPPPLSRSRPSVNLNNLTLAALESATLAELDQVSSKSGIKVEDALLLLTFHHQVVQ